jgi:acetyl-CoA synthetase
MVRRLEFSDLPKTISGKIRRVELRGRETGRPDHGILNDNEYLEESFRG